jgi:hypothetical protein
LILDRALFCFAMNVPAKRNVKHFGHPARTGQARRGRSIPRFARLTALSMSNGLPGHAVASTRFQPQIFLRSQAMFWPSVFIV